jgi:hypothetical protein
VRFSNGTFSLAQLEPGSVATPFEHRSYGDELARCQRYYYNALLESNSTIVYLGNGSQYDGSTSYSVIHFPVTMRTEPSADFSSAGHFQKLAAGSATTCTYLALSALSSASVGTAEYNASGSSGQANVLRSNNASAVFAFTAEL